MIDYRISCLVRVGILKLVSGGAQIPEIAAIDERAGDTGRLKEKGRLRDENISAAEVVSHLCRTRLGERLHCE